MGQASPGGSELAELLPGPAISCTEAVLFFLFLFSLPCPRWAGCSLCTTVSSQSSFLLLSAHYLILSQAGPGNILLSLSSTALHPLPPRRRQKQNKRIMNQTFPFSLRPLFPPLIFHTGQFLPFPSCLFGMWPGLSIPGSLAGSCRSQREFSGGRG